jgi:hypothetical protein
VVQHLTYKKRVRKHSDLSPSALLVAQTIADLRYEAGLRPHEPMPMTVQELADACHFQSRSTARRYLNECLESGWIVGRKVFRNGRQQPNEYVLNDPTATITETKGVASVMGSEGEILRPNPRRIVVKPLDPVLRSKYKGDSDDAPRSGGGGSTDKETLENPPDPVTAFAEAATEWLDQAQQDHRDKRHRQQEGHATPDDRLAANCAHCGGTKPVPSGYVPKTKPRVVGASVPQQAPVLMECDDCGRYWPKAPALAVVG